MSLEIDITTRPIDAACIFYKMRYWRMKIAAAEAELEWARKRLAHWEQREPEEPGGVVCQP